MSRIQANWPGSSTRLIRVMPENFRMKPALATKIDAISVKAAKAFLRTYGVNDLLDRGEVDTLVDLVRQWIDVGF